jgi:hypothetical protein
MIDTSRKQQKEGARMNRITHDAKKPETGIFATLRAFPAGGQGRSAPADGRRLLLLAACLVLAVLWLLPASASATFIRPYICQITGKAGESASASECNGPHVGNTLPSGSFSLPTTLALDGSGDLWVNDVKAGLIDKFGPAGNYLAQGNGESNGERHWRKFQTTGIAYGDTSEHVYLGENETGHVVVWLANPNASFSSGISEAELGMREVTGLAIDNSGSATNGDLYVSGSVAIENETGHAYATIRRFDSVGKPAPFSASAPYIKGNEFIPHQGVEVEDDASIATDSAGDLYTLAKGQASPNAEVYEFAPSGLFLRAFTIPAVPPFGTYIAIDPTNGHVLVLDEKTASVYEFDATGVFLGSGIPAGSFSQPGGMAVDSKGRLYISDTSKRVVDVFGSPVTTVNPPVVVTGKATVIAKHTVTLNATVNPEGAELKECVFEYGETTTYGHTVPCAETPGEIGSGTSLVPVHADVSALNAGAVYHFRLHASNTNGTSESKDETFVTPPAVKLTTGTATLIQPTTATLNGTVDPEGQPVSDCHFEYSGPGITEASAPCVPPPGAGSSILEVHADLTGLQPRGEYAFRLIATNSDGTTEGAAVSFTTAPAVKLETGDATNIASTSATLVGTVDPQGATITECRFEYGVEYALDHTAPCSPFPGSVSEEVEVRADISGLAAGQTYQFRLVAADSEGQSTGALTVFTTPLALPPETACPNAGLRTGPSANLPDCRAYELVSPPDKKGSDIAGMPSRTRASSDGSAISFMSTGAFADAQGMNIATEYMAVRTAAPATPGWATHAITPGNLEPAATKEATEFVEPRYMGEFSSDLSRGFFFSNTALTSGSPDTAEVPNLYMRTDLRTPGPGSYRLLSDCPGCTGPLPQNADQHNLPSLAGESADFSHVIFESEEPLTADVAAQGCTPAYNGNCPDRLYEWTDGQVSLAGLVPPNGDTRCGPRPLDACILAPNSQAGCGANAERHEYTPNTISKDGSRIELTVTTSQAERTGGRLYQRIDNGLPDARTIQINASERTIPAAPQDAIYGGASADGTRVFFTTKEPLTDDAPNTGNNPNLYMWNATPDAQGHHLTLISKSEVGEPASVRGVIGTSEDGRTVYFVNVGQLLSGQPTSGYYRIFRWHDGVLHNVAKIDAYTFEALVGFQGKQGWSAGRQSARVTADGSHLLFLSGGTDELPHNPAGDACKGQRFGCEELFLYDANANGGEGSLACASCSQPDGPASANASFDSLSNEGPAAPTSYLNHPLSADGRFVFFDTPEALVPQDTNGVSDVYEYDSLTGGLRLVSTGESKFASTFEDATPDGSNVFFTTAQRITGWDVDGNADLYDARVGGGLPEPPSPPLSCVGDSCQPPPLSLNDPTPASLSFSGAENPGPTVKEPTKPKRKVVKRSHKRRRHAKHGLHKRAVTRKRGGAK